jgi:Arc/MetJ family transcription regulator
MYILNMYKRTNIELDVALIKEAMKVSHIDTIKEVVHESLRELIKLQKRKKLLKLKGKIKWEGNLDQMRSNG